MTLIRTVGLIAAGVMAAQAAPRGATAQDFPGDRGIELIAGYGPGGGHDTMLRAMAQIMQEEGIVDAPLAVVNKPGGSSAVAMGYLNGHEGDGHYLMSVTSSHVTTPLTSNLDLDYTDFTPIARLGIDPELVVVRAGGPYGSLDDLVSADEVLNVGGTATGSIEHIVALRFADETGSEVNFIPFQGDGEVVAALLSSQVDFIVTNPGPAADFIEAGQFEALAISTDERIEALPDVPTFQEQGIDITLSLFRCITAPGGIDDEAKEWLISKMRELDGNPAWKAEYLDPNSVVPGFLAGDEFGAYLAENEGIYRETLTDLGLIQ